MDGISSSDSTDALSGLADAVIECQIRMRSGRDVRKALEGSKLQESWGEAIGIFTGSAPEARTLLLMIVDRIPEDPMFPDLGQLLIELWLNSRDRTVPNWLREQAKSNPKLRLAMIGVEFEAHE